MPQQGSLAHWSTRETLVGGILRTRTPVIGMTQYDPWDHTWLNLATDHAVASPKPYKASEKGSCQGPKSWVRVEPDKFQVC